LGQELVIHTDHSNLTYSNFTTERVMRWRLILRTIVMRLHRLVGETADGKEQRDCVDGRMNMGVRSKEIALMQNEDRRCARCVHVDGFRQCRFRFSVMDFQFIEPRRNHLFQV
jgi:hypothetical protein